MKKYIVPALLILVAAAAVAQPYIGSYPNAATLTGAERFLASQSNAGVNITPPQIAAYLATNNLTLPAQSAQSGCLTTNGTAASWGNCSVQLVGYAISGLPTCNGASEGMQAYVTNGQISPAYLGAVSTTGSTVAPVFCNGSGWVYH